MNDTTLRTVVFTIDGQRYGIPLDAVERVLPMVAISPLPHGPAVAIGVINVHGTIVPVVDIRRRFGEGQREFGPSAQLVLAHTPRRVLAMPVDGVEGVVSQPSTSVVPSDQVLPHLENLSGIVPLDGDLLFLQDVESFLSLDDERQLTESMEELAHAAVC